MFFFIGAVVAHDYITSCFYSENDCAGKIQFCSFLKSDKSCQELGLNSTCKQSGAPLNPSLIPACATDVDAYVLEKLPNDVFVKLYEDKDCQSLKMALAGANDICTDLMIASYKSKVNGDGSVEIQAFGPSKEACAGNSSSHTIKKEELGTCMPFDGAFVKVSNANNQTVNDNFAGSMEKGLFLPILLLFSLF